MKTISFTPMRPEPDRSRRLLLQLLAALPACLALPACGGGGNGGGGGSGGDEGGGAGAASGSATASLSHPGLLHTEADFTRMRNKVAAAEQPWVDGLAALTTSGYAQLGASPRPVVTVIRGGTGENFSQMFTDMEHTYQLALRWKVTGDTRYADLAVQFLNAWSSTMTTLTGNADRFLAAGIYGYQWANAAEIMRTYSGWGRDGVKRFQTLLLNLFYPLSHQFLTDHNGANIENYWANWDLCSIAGIFAIGVFCDRGDLCDEAVTYYKTGRGNGAAAHNVYVLHPGYLGQWQESGRDQGHATLGMALLGAFCEMAWNQGIDLYGYANNRFLAGAEYVAKANLQDASGNSYSMPFATYVNGHGTATAISTGSLPTLRPCWESIYNHYVHRKGLDAPWVTAMAAKIRPEGNNNNGDQLGFGTLSYSRDALSTPVPPSGLTAYLTAGAVLLSWWGTANASSYTVKRASSAKGPFVVIASGITDPRTYTDAAPAGVWYYAVSAVTTHGETAISNVVRVALPGELIVHLPLNEGTGSVAADSSGNSNTATLASTAAWGAGRTGGKALALDGASGYLALPAGVLSNLGDFTIAVWVYANSVTKGSRIFDFGSSEVAYWCLFPADASGVMRVAVTGTSYYGEQSITASSALTAGKWVHVALSLSGRTGSLYLDGALVASNTAMDLAPFQLGNTTQNWLGRSQYSGDPYFNGRLQDLRIYSGALSSSEIAALASA